MANVKKPSLLQKYNIPIDHLDFKYIEKCQNANEMEKIVQILVSGEEGYYPDLTTCAENKLKELNPGSKVLRVEEPIKRENNMANKEWNEISNMMKDFTCNIKKDSSSIRNSTHTTDSILEHLPAVRVVDSSANKENQSETKTTRIRSCDYSQWDKYDADTEVLKLDLIEEKNHEQNEMKQKKRIEEITNVIKTPIAQHLTGIERRKLAEKYRVCGNEFYRSCDYDDAVVEYTKSIQILIDARSYNNRAMAYIKLKRHKEAITDCDECLKIEPDNVKALLRKGDCLLKDEQMRNAYETYQTVTKVEPDNKIAIKMIDDLRKKLPELPPANAFRLNIRENGAETQPVVQTKSKKIDIPADDLSKLVIPKRIVKSKVSQMASGLSGLTKTAQDDLKKMKNNYEKKKCVDLFPRAHDDSWKGAFIEEIK